MRIYITIILIISMNAYSSYCMRTEWNDEQSNYQVVENCERNVCGAYKKWDLLYFSKEMFNYPKGNNFYSIKEKQYSDNHCLVRVTGKRFGIKMTRSGDQEVIEDINEVVLIDSNCPKVGTKIKGKLIYQRYPMFWVSMCARDLPTGRLYLKQAKG